MYYLGLWTFGTKCDKERKRALMERVVVAVKKGGIADSGIIIKEKFIVISLSSVPVI
jgi:hypothetical protein